MIENKLIDDIDKLHFKKSIIFYSVISSKNISDKFNLSAIDKINKRMIKRDLLPVLSRNDNFELETANNEVKTYLKRIISFNS